MKFSISESSRTSLGWDGIYATRGFKKVMNWKPELSVCSTGAFPAHFQPNETRNMQIAPTAGKEKLRAGACPRRAGIHPCSLLRQFRLLLSAQGGKSPSAAAGKGSGHGESSAQLPWKSVCHVWARCARRGAASREFPAGPDPLRERRERPAPALGWPNH